MAINAVDQLEQASEEFEEAARLKPREAAEKAVEYHRYKKAPYILTADGEKVDRGLADRKAATLNNELKKYLQDGGEPITAEGIPDLVLQYRKGPENVDVKSLYEHDRATFERLLESNALLVNMPMLDAMQRSNLIAADVPRMPTAGSWALVFVGQAR